MTVDASARVVMDSLDERLTEDGWEVQARSELAAQYERNVEEPLEEKLTSAAVAVALSLLKPSLPDERDRLVISLLPVEHGLRIVAREYRFKYSTRQPIRHEPLSEPEERDQTRYLELQRFLEKLKRHLES